MQALLDEICSSAAIPSVPVVAANVLSLSKDPNVDFAQLSSMVSADAALVAKLLRMANSAVFGGQAKIASVRNALVRMGIKVTRVTVLGFALEAEIGSQAPPEFDIERFWRHSLTTATTARAIAERICPARRDDAFAAGILQDIGIVAFQFAMPEKYAEVFKERKRSTADLHYIEMEVIGTTHMHVGHHLLKKWGLPPEVYEPILYHHRIEEAKAGAVSKSAFEIVRLLNFSTLVTRLFNYKDKGMTQEAARVVAEEELGIEHEALDRILEQVEAGVRETCDLFSLDPRTIPSYAHIQVQAAQEVARLGLELGQEARAAETRAREQTEQLDELRSEADELKELASHDDLTGLPNRREFMKRFVAELTRCQRYEHGIGFLILDIDHFKSVNDTYGHPAGDAALQGMGDFLAREVRRCDLPARWGGEEFVILLPEARGLAGVVAAAEKLRQGIEKESNFWVEEAGGVTVSIGAVYANHDSADFEAEAIIEEADKGLYRAKEQGRNQVQAVTV